MRYLLKNCPCWPLLETFLILIHYDYFVSSRQDQYIDGYTYFLSQRSLLTSETHVSRSEAFCPQSFRAVTEGSELSADHGSLFTIVSWTTVMFLESPVCPPCCRPPSSPRICSSLPHAVPYGTEGGCVPLLLTSVPGVVCSLLERGWLREGRVRRTELNRALSPTLEAPFRIRGWIIGRLDTTIVTNVSRHAHWLPDTAPSGPA